MKIGLTGIENGSHSTTPESSPSGNISLYYILRR